MRSDDAQTHALGPGRVVSPPPLTPEEAEAAQLPDPADVAADQLVLVARLHYEHGLTHHEIAARLGLSRVKVTRLLAEARRTGVVRISIEGESGYGELESALVDRWGLLRASVAPSFETRERTAASVSVVAAKALTELVSRSSVIAVGVSAAVAQVVTQLRDVEGRHVTFVPAAGTSGGRASVLSPGMGAAALGFAFGGHAYQLPAPLLTQEARTAELLRADPAVADTLDAARAADVLVVGLGAVNARFGTLAAAAGSDALLRVRELGAVGDICGSFFDAQGRQVRTELDARLVALPFDDLLRIPTRVAITTGWMPGLEWGAKIPAIRASLVGGIINTLVIDEVTGKALLE